MRRQAGTGLALVTAAAVVAGAGNFVFHAVVGRTGGAAAYGSIGVLLSVATVTTFLVTGVQYAVARMVSVSGHSVNWRLAIFHSLWPGVATVAALAMVSPLIAGFLLLPGPGLVLLSLLTILAILGTAVPYGVLVGLRRFGLTAALVALSMVLRVGSVVVIAELRLFDPRTGALLASLLASFAILVLAAMLAVGSLAAAQPAAPAQDGGTQRLAAEGTVSVVLSGMLWLAWLLPLAFARHNLGGVEAGRFAAVQLLAGGVLFLTAPIVTVFYPLIAADPRTSYVLSGLSLTAAVCLVSVAGVTLLGPFMVGVVYGPQFAIDRGLAAAVTLAASMVAMTTYVMWVSRAVNRYTGWISIAIAVALAGEVVVASAWGRSALALALGPALILLAVGGIGSFVWAAIHLAPARSGSSQ